MKSIFSKKDNVLREQPEISEPVWNANDWNGFGEFKKFSVKYDEHKKSLRTLPCAPNSFVDGVEYEQDKDYKVDIMHPIQVGGSIEYAMRAVPITQSNNEDEWQDDMWQTVIDTCLNDGSWHNEDLLPKLKSLFTITRKGA